MAARRVEEVCRFLTMLLPDRFGSGALFSESVYSVVNLLSLLHAHAARKQIDAQRQGDGGEKRAEGAAEADVVDPAIMQSCVPPPVAARARPPHPVPRSRTRLCAARAWRWPC